MPPGAEHITVFITTTTITTTITGSHAKSLCCTWNTYFIRCICHVKLPYNTIKKQKVLESTLKQVTGTSMSSSCASASSTKYLTREELVHKTNLQKCEWRQVARWLMVVNVSWSRRLHGAFQLFVFGTVPLKCKMRGRLRLNFKRSLPRSAHAQSLFGFSPMSAVAPLANPPPRVTSRVYFSRKARSDASKRAPCREDTSEGAGGTTAVGSNSSKRFLGAASPLRGEPSSSLISPHPCWLRQASHWANLQHHILFVPNG